MRKAHGARLKICEPKIYFNAVADNRLLQNCGDITQPLSKANPFATRRRRCDAARVSHGPMLFAVYAPRALGRGAHTVAAPSSWRLPVLVPLLLGPHCGQLCSKQHRP